MKINRRKLKDSIWGFFFITPLVLGLGVFYFYPFFQVFIDSFYKIGAFDRRMGFVGLDNYKALIQDAEMWQTLGNTFKYVIIILPFTVIFSLLIATLLNSKVKGQGVFRVLYFLPAITMQTAVAMVWKMIFNGDYGILNAIVKAFGGEPVRWLTDGKTALICICVVAIWSNVGYYMVILLAGIQGISKVYYEAADIDGASEWNKFSNITLPLITPTLFYVVIMIIISTFQTFDGIYLMIGTKSAVIKETQSVVMYFYRQAFDYPNKGYGSSIAVLLFAIIMSITVVQMKLQNKWVNYD